MVGGKGNHLSFGMESSIEGSPSHETDSTKKSKTALRDDALRYTESLAKRGVIYVSRVPPFMKPNKMRGIFEEYGEVTRLYLAEEGAEQRKKRKELGGNASKQFKEGWVEYSDKKVAKRVAESLNNTIIGGKKGSFYHDDIWNLKYLRGFKYSFRTILHIHFTSFRWEYLTEKVAYERRTREAKLQAALQVTKKQNAEFAELVDKAKIERQIAEKKERKRKRNNEEDSAEENKLAEKRTAGFHQVKPIADNYGDTAFSVVGKDTLKKIFKSKQER